jgi:hypothetical protein
MCTDDIVQLASSVDALPTRTDVHCEGALVFVDVTTNVIFRKNTYNA